MPELRFHLRWPDDRRTIAYSPSSTVRDAFVLRHPYPLDEFLRVSRAALEHASTRVAQKYGMGCGAALAQIDALEREAARYRDVPGAQVVVEAFEP